MAVGIDLGIGLANDALGIYDVAGALPEVHAFPLGLSQAQSFHERGAGIGEQADVEGEFGAEIFVLSDIIRTYAHDFDACGVEIGFRCGECLTLHGAARRVVFGIEVDDEPVTGEVCERGGFTVLIGEREIRK